RRCRPLRSLAHVVFTIRRLPDGPGRRARGCGRLEADASPVSAPGGPSISEKECAVTLTRSVGIGLWLCLAAQTTSGVAPSPPPSSASGAEDFAREAYVVEESKTVVRFEADGTGRREVYERINVHSDAGVEKWGQLTFPYTSATERMTIASVNVRKRNGTVVAAPAEAVQDLSSPVERIAPVYTDTREKHVTVPGLRPGDILEFTVVTDRHTPIAPGEYWMEYDFVTQAIV